MFRFSRLLTLSLFLLASTFYATEANGYLPHLTPAHARVQTTLIFFNPTAATQTIHLINPINYEIFTIDLAAGEGLRLPASELDYPQSLTYHATSAEVDIKLAYDSHLMARQLTVTPPNTAATTFRFEAMDTNRLWQGFVALNVSGDPTDVTVFQYSSDGEILGELPIADDLAPGYKVREVLNNFDWEVQEGAYFEVVASHPVSVIMLYGTYLNDGNADMRIANGTAIKAPRMRFTRPNGDTLIVTRESITLNNHSIAFSGFDQIWNQFQAYKLNQRNSNDQTTSLFTAQFERGQHSTSWAIDQEALMQDYPAMKAADLIESLFQLAQ